MELERAMTLGEVCKAEFGEGDRARGGSAKMLHKIEIKEAGQYGVLAVAEGSYDEQYLVGIDFAEISRGLLGVHCDCPRFQSGHNCKHLWATIGKVDLLYQVNTGRSRQLELYAVHPTEIEIGQPRTRIRLEDLSATTEPPQQINAMTVAAKTMASTAGSVSTQTDHSSSTTKRSAANWKAKLQEVAAASRDRSLIRRTDTFNSALQPMPLQRQHWFVFSVASEENQFGLSIAVMQSVRQGDGPWSIPATIQLGYDSAAEISCPHERAAIETLIPMQDDRSYYYDEPQMAIFAVDEFQVAASLTAMHATGRLAWKLGDSYQHFQDARAVNELQFDLEYELSLHFRPSNNGKKQFEIIPTLECEGELISVEHVIWVSEIGCALVQLIDGNSQPDTSNDDASGEGVGSPKTRMIKVLPDQVTQIQAWQQAGILTVPNRSLRSALEDLSDTASQIPLTLDPSLGISVKKECPTPRCSFQQKEHYESVFDVSLSAAYGDIELAFESTRCWWFDSKTRTVYQRNWQAEVGYLESVASDVFEFTDGSSFQASLDVPPSVFIDIIETLQTAGWEVTAGGAPVRIASDFDISVSSGVDWFDLNGEVDFDGVSASLPILLKALQRGENSVILDDGSQGMLPKEWLQKFVNVEACGDSCGDAIRFHRSQALLLDTLLDEQEVAADRDFTRFVKRLRSFDGIKPTNPPKTFSGELREYQQIGLGWFDFLQKFGFGGCLADDMGLGKTIQVLALLDKRRSRRLPKGTPRKPSIAVVPKSLVGNWIDEAARFTPQLRLLNYTGVDRKARLKEAQASRQPPHILITTYGTLRNDVTKLREQEFDYVILDEAQAIKNPKSISSKSARLLQGDHRLAMTGTPVENHLGDLWALFDFLNPGMLKPGVTSRLPQLDDEEDRKRVEQIGESLRPFILRRTKQQVLKDLPDKVEQTLSCDMTKPQRKLYDELREHYRVHLSKKVEELGLKRSKIHVLEALLRLRQASCDPRLVKPDCDVRGAKIEMLLSQLSEIIENGHKALVFSQFTSLLGLLRDDIDSRKWDYEYLDGKTRKRADRVKRFQTQADCQLFLISLKAGGTGLNLTAAEYVFILDPWWNPAVEAQAIDRAHRIGQTNSVNAYRMICNDSVEEKIVELQGTKRELADAIISQDKSLISDLTSDDLQALLG